MKKAAGFLVICILFLYLTSCDRIQPVVSEITTPIESECVQIVPINNVPYTTTLAASAAIYTAPGGSFSGYVGEDDIYTIVEEAYDDDGNLWGRLKSGIGWVWIGDIAVSSMYACPQCGKMEPEAIFEEDWKPGDLCFGCSYLNVHGGEDARLFCSQCGADCTFRGLEEDGRCEDCTIGSFQKVAQKSEIEPNTWYIYDNVLCFQNCELKDVVSVGQGKALLVQYYAVCQYCHTIDDVSELAGPEVNYDVERIHYCDVCERSTLVKFKID